MSLQYRPEIDGLRALAVLPVIFFHAGLNVFQGGYVGVDIFFVISGYLIGYIILDKVAHGNFSIIEFYENRARRILPALFVVIAACIPLAWWLMDPSQWKEFSKSLTWVSLFSSNYYFWLQSGYFAEASEFKPLLHTWSLAVEEQYYLIFPLLMAGLWRFGRKMLIGVISILTIASFALCIWMVAKYPSANFFSLPTRMWELLIGVLCAFVLYYDKLRRTDHKSISAMFEFLGVGLILYSIFFFSKNTPFPSVYTLVPVIGAAFLILFSHPRSLIGKALSNRLMVGIGLISYSAYLWHQPLFAFARIKNIEAPSQSTMMVLAGLSLIFAFLTWKFIEQPFRIKRNSNQISRAPSRYLKRRSVFTMSLGGILMFVTLGQLQTYEIMKPKRLNLYVDIDQSLKQASNLRLEGIRFGQCDFYPTIGWQGKWDCAAGTGKDKDLIPVPVALIGDSHASDKAMMLRQSGFSPTSFASSGCPITPNYVRPAKTKKDKVNQALLAAACYDLMKFAREKIANNPEIEEIWLSNSFTKERLELDVIKQSLEYWSTLERKLVFFSQSPNFPDLSRKLRKLPSGSRLPEYSVDLKIYELSARPELITLLNEYDVTFIDMVSIACSSNKKCDYKNDSGDLLYTDGAHLAISGAKYFGENLLRQEGCSGATKALEEMSQKAGLCEY